MSSISQESSESSESSTSAQSAPTRAKPRQALTLGLTLICAAVLAACGGGSDDTASIPESIAQTNDPVVALDSEPLPSKDPVPELVTGPTKVVASPYSGRMQLTRAFGANAEPGKLTPAVPGALNIADISIAQSHVVSNGKRVWTQPELPKGGEVLRVTNSRDALVLVRLSAKDAVDPVLELWEGNYKSATLRLQPPSALPATEDGGQRYGDDVYSAMVPGDMVWDGLELKVSSKNYARGNSLPLDVSAEYQEELRTLPIYLFGATDTNSGYPLSRYGAPSEEAVRELNARMPFDFQVSAHGARKVVWEKLVARPDGSRPARLIRNYDDSGPILGITLDLMDSLRRANGENQSPVTYFSPVLGFKSDGSVRPAYGGEGWGGSATGDWSYSGVFIHELGHTFGMGHARSSYESGEYPYRAGSLLGSSWGWDATRSLILPTFIPPSASNFKNCASRRVLDEQGRCVKEDLMQSGAGDQAKGVRFAMFSDFSAAVMQRHMESNSVMPEGDGSFVRFNRSTRQWESFEATTTNYAQGGIAQNLPLQTNVPVYTLFVAFSNTTPEANLFYEPIKYTGNLLGRIDPTKADDLAAIDPTGKGVYRNFCRSSGCDYTLRLTYEDGSQGFQLLQGGFRTSNAPSGDFSAAAMDPLKSASLRIWYLNVPANKRLVKTELLYTPEGWKGVPAQPRVVMSRDL